jgi:hypothetical protein
MAVYTEVNSFTELKDAVEQGADDDFIVITGGFSGSADGTVSLTVDKKVTIAVETDVTIGRAAGFLNSMLNVASGHLVLGSPAYGGTLTLDGSGASAVESIVTVTASGSFTMNSGTLENNINTAGDGGGLANNGVFTMNGGTISGNSAAGNGGGEGNARKLY